KWPDLMRRGYEFFVSLVWGCAEYRTNPSVISEDASYLELFGYTDRSIMLARELGQSGTQYGYRAHAANAYSRISEILLLAGTLDQAKVVFDRALQVFDLSIINYITDDNRTYSPPKLTTGAIELMANIDFWRGDRLLDPYWTSRGVLWILAAIQVGKLEEARSRCEVESRQRESSVDHDFSELLSWRLVYAEILARVGDIPNAEAMLRRAEEDIALDFLPWNRYLFARAKASVLLQKNEVWGCSADNDASQTLADARIALTAGLRETMTSFY